MSVRARANSPLCAPDIHSVAPTSHRPKANRNQVRLAETTTAARRQAGKPCQYSYSRAKNVRTEEEKINLYRLVPHTGTSTEHHHHPRGAGTVCEFHLGTKAPRGFASEDDQRDEVKEHGFGSDEYKSPEPQNGPGHIFPHLTSHRNILRESTHRDTIFTPWKEAG